LVGRGYRNARAMCVEDPRMTGTIKTYTKNHEKNIDKQQFGFGVKY